MHREGQYITKGTKVQFRYFKTRLAGLAGFQMKLGVTEVVGEGVIEHLYADHPTDPTKVQVHARDGDGRVHKFEKMSITKIYDSAQ